MPTDVCADRSVSLPGSGTIRNGEALKVCESSAGRAVNRRAASDDEHALQRERTSQWQIAYYGVADWAP